MLHSNLEYTLTTKDTSRWHEALEQTEAYSLYHLPEFHRLAELRGEGKAVMPVFQRDGYTMVFPMLLREMGKFNDATSVRGFSGPLTSHRDLPEDIRQAFLADLNEFFVQNKIICVYSRLHPVACDSAFLHGYGELVQVGVTLSIDLTKPLEVQWDGFRSDYRKKMRRLRRNGFVCGEVGIERIDEVVDIYHQTMRRVGADPAFFYDRSYFEYLLGDMSNDVKLYSCMLDNHLASVHICGTSGGIIESYLSGTADEYVEHAPSRLLYDAFRILGSAEGAKSMHLGGGVGAQRDSLFNFKAGFASNEHAYYTWRHIVDKTEYAAACNAAGCQLDSSYFPAYRDPKAVR